jgi:hypothetical protein
MSILSKGEMTEVRVEEPFPRPLFICGVLSFEEVGNTVMNTEGARPRMPVVILFELYREGLHHASELVPFMDNRYGMCL